MERPRPRAKHRPRSSNRGPSYITPSKEMTRPRPSSSRTDTQRISVNPDYPPKTNPILLLQSLSPESKEAQHAIFDDDMYDLTLSPRSVCSDTSAKEEDILAKLNEIEQNRILRKSALFQDLDEIKQFLSNESSSTPAHKSIPTSLQMMGIHDPKSLLYHRDLDRNMVNGHHRAQTQNIVFSQEHNLSRAPQKLNINKKYNHLRSASSIMNNDKTYSSRSKRESLKVGDYVQHVKNRKPSQIFDTIPDQKSLQLLAALVDEYNSGSDDEDDDVSGTLWK